MVERHGFWKPDISSFVAAARQLSLDEVGGSVHLMDPEPQPRPTLARVPNPSSDPSEPDEVERVDDTEMTNEEFEDGMARGVPPEGSNQADPSAEVIQMHPEPEVPPVVDTDAPDGLADRVRIEPEPIPAEAYAAARPNGDGPKVVPFDPADMEDGPGAREVVTVPSEGGERPGGRDKVLDDFLSN